MLKKIKFFLKKIIFIIFYRDKKIFYRDCYNSLNFGHLIFWNLVRPGRLLTRIRYKRFLFPKKIKKDDINIYIDTKSLSKNEIIEIAAKKLKKYGTVVLNQYFNEETLSKFENEYKNYFNMLSYQPSNLTSSTATLPLSKTLADLWFDEIITSIIEKYIKRLPVARNYPNLQSMTPKHSVIEGDYLKNKTDFAYRWHVDHSTLIQPAIYFDDVTERGSHMEVILGSHTYPNVSNAGNLSGEYVIKNNLTIGKCVGKRGSVQIHCGNVYHRFSAVQNSTRTWLKFEFCSGNNVLLNPQQIGRMLKNDFNLSSLDDRSRTIISSLFPLPLNKGYEVKKEVFEPTKFKGI